MLLILSEKDDLHIPLITEKLDKRGVEYLWFAPSSFPSQAQFSTSFTHQGVANPTLWYEGNEYDLSQVQSIWNRRPGLPTPNPQVTEATHRHYVEIVCRTYLEGLWELMKCRWLPATPSVDKKAHNKLLQLDLATRVGFKIPETLITNNPDDFLDFWTMQGGALISKPLCLVDLNRDGEIYEPYTHPIHRRDARYYQNICHETVIFQPYISKQVELRVTVVGDQVFAAEIASQGNRSTQYDWRHYENVGLAQQYHIHQLPDAVALNCVNLVKALSLSYGAIDLILTPEGEYVFLEINSNGQWGWIEELTGLPIAEAITNWLIGCEAITI